MINPLKIVELRLIHVLLYSKINYNYYICK